MRALIGVGTPRGLQGRLAALMALVMTLQTAVVDVWRLVAAHAADFTRIIGSNCFPSARQNRPFNHGLLAAPRVAAC